MNELTVFDFKGNDVRTLTMDGEPYFVGKDVCKAFGDTNHKRSLSRLDDNDKTIAQIKTPGGSQNMIIINESGLYALLFQMQPAKAKGVSQNDPLVEERIQNLRNFKHWVTSEVLPAIRKTGGYVAGEKDADDDELVLRVIQMLENKIAQKNKKIENQSEQIKIQEQQILDSKPKVSYYDKVLQSKEAIRTKVIAGDYGMSAQKFNKKLNELHVQYKVGNTWVLYREHQGNGYTQTKTFTKETDSGYVITNTQTCWTQKGRLFLYDLLKSNGVLPEIEQE